MYRLTLKGLAKLTAVLFIAIATKTQAQTTESSFQTPNFAPKSPEATAFLKYGEYPVDLSTGVPGISIPLYSVDIKDFKLPISLNYHASGIKVTQEATWVGLGWNLNAGAQVVLSPRDDIDENTPFIDQIPDDDAIIAYFKLHPYKHNVTSSFLDPDLDKSRVKDMYVFSSPTVNGSFYIKNFEQKKVVTIPPDAFKVELLGSTREYMRFKITDVQGNIYSLNTTEVSERSMTHGDRYISAWYVDEITTPGNNKINFTYQDDGSLVDVNSSQRIEIKKIARKGGCYDENFYSQVGEVINEGGNTITLTKKIKEIIFNEGNSKVVFTKINGRQDLINGNGYLSKIEIKQRLNNEFQNVKGFTFEYTYFNNTSNSYLDKRLKLDRIVNLFGQDEQEFVYSDIPLPNKRSKGQDYFGYNNGALNSQDMIPKHFISDPYATEVGHGQRSVSSSVIQAGMLKEIYYPTKGRTKFTFENNQFYGIDVFDKYQPIIVNSAVIQGTGGTVPVKEGPGIDDGTVCLNPNPNDCVNYVSIPFTANAGTGYLTYQFSKPEGDHPTLFKYHFAKVRVISAGQQVYYSGILVDHKNVQNVPLSNLQSGTIEVAVYGEYYSIRNLQLKYVNNGPILKNNLGAGLRIKSIENYDHDTSLLLKKEYDYSDITDNTRTSGKLINDLCTSFISGRFTNYSYVNCGGYETTAIACVGGLSSDAVYSISSNSRYGIEGNSVIYKYVKEKQVGPTNNGYTLYEFTTAGDEIPFGNSAVQITTPWKRGKVLRKKIYKTIGIKDYILEDEINTYFEDASSTAFYNGFKMFRNAKSNATENTSDPLTPACPFNYDGGIEVLQTIEPITYNIPILWYYQKESKKSSYFYDATNSLTGTLVSTTNFNYSNPSHLQLTSQATTSSTGETIESKFYYAQDSQLAGRPFVNELKEAHMIGIPLDTQTFKSGTKLSEQLTVYDKSNSTNNLLLPKSVYINKGPGIVDLSENKKITYDQYDDKGNVLQYTPENGIPVSIIWGYNKTQPIAKIDNIAYSSIPVATITNLQSLSNADSDNCLSENCTEQLLRNALNIFQNSFPDAFISTYTYNPLVGVTSITDPKRNTAYYEYDTYGRLKFVKDKDLNVLQKYCYNYKGQSIDCSDNSSTTIVLYRSIARSGSFAKNNCAAGGVPSTVSYSQPVGAATSVISQADADSKGLAKFNTDGQANANTNGICTFSSIARSGSFTKNNCSAGGAGSSVAFNQTAGVVTSITSQADADSQGLALFNTNGQANANANGICTFSSIAKSGSFTRNNCEVGGVGSAVVYTVPAGRHTSTTSQAAADELTQTDLNNNGQANANTNGTCTFSSIARSGSFAKNNCATGGAGSSVAFSQAAGVQTSTISQADADSKGLALFNTNGQANANTNGICTFSSIARSGSFTKNNCAAGGSGSSVAFSQAIGTVTSIISQADADSQGLALFNTNGQANANANGNCTFSSISQSGTFTRNNCDSGKFGSNIIYTQPIGAVVSTISQSDADSKGLTLFTTNGQANANTNGTCVFKSIARSGSFTKNNCPSGHVGSSLNYTQEAGAATSAVSQVDADSLGLTLFNTNGQARANNFGSCSVSYTNEYYFNSSTKKLYIYAFSADPNHTGATLTFNVNYIRTSGQQSTKTVTIVLAAGQVENQTNTSLLASSVIGIDMTVELIRTPTYSK